MIKGLYKLIYSTLEEKRLWEDIKSGKGIPPIVRTEEQYDYIEEEKLWESIKSGERASHLNIPLQKNVPPMPEKNKEYKEKSSWIPVKDRLPEINKEVLVYLFTNNQPHIAWWNGTHWQTDEFVLDDCEYEPLAWFPLPEPYKGDN